jgi:hypothetical protein
MKNFTLYFLLIITLFSCKKSEVSGIEIGQDLYIGQSLEQNRKLSELITQTLNKNSNALSELTEFWCGGGAGCYDLGIILSQIVYKLGESEFIQLVEELNSNQKNNLKGLLNAGLEYGYEPDRKIQSEFPKLYKNLTKEIDVSESEIEEPIGIYNLRKSIIDKQNLDTWPSIIHIRSLADFNNKKKDSLILFIAETDSLDYLRITRTSDLSKFAEIEYKGNCKQQGTILTDLKIGKILSNGNEAIILCRKEEFINLKIKN